MKSSNLQESATVAIHNLAQEKMKLAQKVYNFSAGDPCIKNHDLVIERVMKLVELGYSPYAPVAGLKQLRDLASSWLNQTCKSNFSVENVVVTSGGKFALYLLLCALLRPKDEVLLLAPYWVSYPAMVELAGGVAKIVHAKKGLKVGVEEIAKAISATSKILIINSANNPTGEIYSQEELEAILELAHQHQLHVISDEVYSGLAYEKDHPFISCASFPKYREQVSIVQSCSKNFALSGWRIGLAVAPVKLVTKICSLQGQTITAASLASQEAAIAALENYAEVNLYVKREMQKRRDLFIQEFNLHFNAGIRAPKSALYAFIPQSAFGTPQSINGVAFCSKLLQDYNAAVVPGCAFGVQDYVRLSFACPESDIVDGLKAIKRATQEIWQLEKSLQVIKG
ncbi:MAG: aminotransferase class I/II-fold pyridoxal phosphate-dependent enzyme [Oligoflexia bacterium]|nr:aminotransferase class I/II-fold pyridoxal phosphate-dependent enzyme [Oligoflexia bacterium]MBF0366139.1 aminotransferase class I/II-fold pyridoxal phosphate-dependent enzyme [Oligoflexia bacterium]